MYQPSNSRRPSFYRRQSAAFRALTGLLALTGAGLTLAGCGGSSNSGSNTPANGVDTVGSLTHITQVASTVDAANADNNPYALAIAPMTFTGDGNPAHRCKHIQGLLECLPLSACPDTNPATRGSMNPKGNG